MVNVYTATLKEIRAALDDGTLTSVQLIEQYLQHIEQHNHNLHAVISVPPSIKIIATAAVLDDERRKGVSRGSLHGIPIIIKDNILTHSDLGMGTTGGSIGLVGAISSRNAALVDRLLQAGMIVLAKANLTEFAGLKGTAITPGWSAVGGQTQSPFIEGGMKEGETMLGHTAPGGSSTGSAVSVAAGFAPLALGTETVGSVVLPAGRAGVYAFRAAYGSVPMRGVLHLTPDIDMIGTFGRCSEDLRELTACLQDRQDLLTTAAEIHSGNRSLGVAFADVKEWIFGQEVCPGDESLQQQMIAAYEDVVTKLNGPVKTQYPVKLPDPSSIAFEHEGKTYGIIHIAFHQLRGLIDDFLQAFDTCKVRSLKELIEYNDQHPKEAFSSACENQEDLIKVLNDTSDPEVIKQAIEKVKEAGKSGLDEIFSKNVDLIAAPCDSSFALLTAAAGYPMGIVPFPKVLEPIGRPYGLALVAKMGREEDVFRFMAIWEKVICPQRPLPQFLKS